jgi:dihydroorotate dehydrogenase
MEALKKLKPNLQNPFTIASCHLTGDENAIDRLLYTLNKWEKEANNDNIPSAIILKSISNKGGDGKTGKRIMFRDKEYKFIRYTDGAKTKELLNLASGVNLIQKTREIINGYPIKIGASILLGEYSADGKTNYTKDNIQQAIDNGADFIELNTKYLSRSFLSPETGSDEIIINTFKKFKEDIDICLEACSKPIWIKFARDIPWLKGNQLINFAQSIQRDDIAFVLANTRQVNIIDDDHKIDNGKAVIWGESLFSETYDLIKYLKPILPDHISIVATGGITTYRQTKELLDIGVAAIQYCAYLHDGKRDFAQWKTSLCVN